MNYREYPMNHSSVRHVQQANVGRISVAIFCYLALICWGGAAGAHAHSISRPTDARYNQAIADGVWCGEALSERKALFGDTNAVLPCAASGQAYVQYLKSANTSLASHFVDTYEDDELEAWFQNDHIWIWDAGKTNWVLSFPHDFPSWTLYSQQVKLDLPHEKSVIHLTVTGSESPPVYGYQTGHLSQYAAGTGQTYAMTNLLKSFYGYTPYRPFGPAPVSGNESIATSYDHEDYGLSNMRKVFEIQIATGIQPTMSNVLIEEGNYVYATYTLSSHTTLYSWENVCEWNTQLKHPSTNSYSAESGTEQSALAAYAAWSSNATDYGWTNLTEGSVSIMSYRMGSYHEGRLSGVTKEKEHVNYYGHERHTTGQTNMVASGYSVRQEQYSDSTIYAEGLYDGLAAQIKNFSKYSLASVTNYLHAYVLWTAPTSTIWVSESCIESNWLGSWANGSGSTALLDGQVGLGTSPLNRYSVWWVSNTFELAYYDGGITEEQTRWHYDRSVAKQAAETNVSILATYRMAEQAGSSVDEEYSRDVSETAAVTCTLSTNVCPSGPIDASVSAAIDYQESAAFKQSVAGAFFVSYEEGGDFVPINVTVSVPKWLAVWNFARK